ncbi:MAG: class I SAM-dependent methyltransferase [Rhodospirillales bacterium]|nr:class I SAM-dependent methyltransferase [Rhodospirillales bacterium]
MTDEEAKQALVGLSIDKQEMLERLAPYISSSVSKDSADGRLLIRQRFKNLLHMIALFYIKQLKLGRRAKTGELVQNLYNTAYATSEFDGYNCQGRNVTYLYGDQVHKMVSMGNYRSKSHVIEKAINIIQPKTMCEIGCGKGRHVFYFGHKFPGTQFTGIDFSSNAIDLAKRTQQCDTIDLHLPEKPGALSEQERNAVRTIDFQVGNACDLSNIKDNAFEVVYTVSALEQMAHILPEVLAEIHRVTSKYVIFCEPFWDKNDFLGRRYLTAGNYFRAKTSVFEKAGFEMLNYLDCLPLKPSFKDTVFIGKVIKK